MTQSEGRNVLSGCKKALVPLAILAILGEIYLVARLESNSTSVSLRSHQLKNLSFSEESTVNPFYDSEESEKTRTFPHSQQHTTTQLATNDELTYDSAEEKLQSEIAQRLRKASDKKIIIIWSVAFGNRDPHQNNREKCGECEVTYDRSLISDERTLAVVFHFDSIRSNDMPSPRNPRQLHIFWDMESPATLRVTRGLSLKFEDSYGFNATMTHRLDSTFLASYQSAALADDLMGKNESVYDDIMKKKSKFAVAMISNCGYTNGARIRLANIKELIKLGLPLEGYGGCFGRKPDWKTVPQLIEKYKFYFAYENSNHCKDYITEKFFHNALRNHAVPVVWGALKEDYAAIAPPGSYIYAEDFETPQKLIDYLRFLDKNDEEYLKYFKWITMKPETLPQYKRTRGFCAICRELHGIHADERFNPKYLASKPLVPMFTDGVYPRTIPSLIGWFYGDDRPECFSK